MGDPKFEAVNGIPVYGRIEVQLAKKRSNLGSWWMDEEGTIGHDCLHHFNGSFPVWFSRVSRGYDPVKGCFRSYCMTCGSDAPEEVFDFAALKKFGKVYKEAMKKP